MTGWRVGYVVANEAITNNDLLLGTRTLITPFNYKVVVIGNTVQVLKQQTVVDDGNDDLAPVEIISDSGLLWPAVIGTLPDDFVRNAVWKCVTMWRDIVIL